MDILYPLSKHWLQLNCCVREHVLGTAQGTHCVVVDVQTKAVEAQEHAHPVQMGNNRVAMTNHPIQQVVDVLSWIIVTHHEDGSVSPCTNDQETTNPDVMGEE